jgi:hypothetical protein
MMHGASRVGFSEHDTCPQRFRPDPDVRDCRQPPHPGCLRRLIVELKGLDDPDSPALAWDRGFTLRHDATNRHGIPPVTLDRRPGIDEGTRSVRARPQSMGPLGHFPATFRRGFPSPCTRSPVPRGGLRPVVLFGVMSVGLFWPRRQLGYHHPPGTRLSSSGAPGCGPRCDHSAAGETGGAPPGHLLAGSWHRACSTHLPATSPSTTTSRSATSTWLLACATVRPTVELVVIASPGAVRRKIDP